MRTCCVIAEERPRIQLTTSFTKLFANLGLTPRSVSTSFGCRVNLGMALQVGLFFRDSIYIGCFTKKSFLKYTKCSSKSAGFVIWANVFFCLVNNINTLIVVKGCVSLLCREHLALIPPLCTLTSEPWGTTGWHWWRREALTVSVSWSLARWDPLIWSYHKSLWNAKGTFVTVYERNLCSFAYTL